MMKLRRIFSLMIAVIMVLAMNVAVFAADTAKITVASVGEGQLSHTFEVYQIFTGDYSENTDGNAVLSNLKWGRNGTGKLGESVGEDVINALAQATGSDSAKLDVIEEYWNVDSEEIGTVTSGSSLNVVNGYYLLKDVTGLSGKDDANSTNVVEVVGGEVIVTPKKAKPTVDKEVYDNDDGSATGDNNGWGETADHAINESFQFRLTAEIPEDTNFGAYKTYQVVFNDTMSNGVTFESIESVKVGNEELEVSEYNCSANANQAGGSWTLTITDIIPHLGLQEGVEFSGNVDIEVIYNAHLNENAVVTEVGEGKTATNENRVNLQYSNNPNVAGLGRTPDDSVWVFTYEMPNTKVDGENKPLGGAGFTLYDSTGNNAIKLIAVNANTGEYRVAGVNEESAITEMTSANNTGYFNISGLDAGTYILKETTTPSGYNTCADVTVVISATHSEVTGGASAAANVTMTMNGEESTNNTIVNQSGTILPETGGIGTRIFYAVGAILMIGAVVLLISRKRSAR